ncbi:actin-related protein 2/3 complex subunit 1A/1B (macronuclear) [Tetrahymena thermophila SB210]|uniref:Arp2/3 complex 41 kDa subunit n=1 Tax=Tetrahymena thermophila (strain SB210) TaxID=312017 RepID=Q22Y88_TETTS|nr:actin-related protein 2/3 complex subunit 1A/1B [Tetrahymena thermophila SB210]EAR90136.1 actin-related protein 2/3 complex subunit 1A/1B [Tetrahymena thermophila SB210]|eukprot:XP_001010381.1 actin-related protein 2/3 complex subunit 1A/1B [Tetrahymena thermophila SB210]
MQELPAVDKIFKEEGVVCHTFSPDGTLCAVSLKKSHVIEIYSLKKDSFRQINTWQYKTQLKEHTQTISGLSFSINNQLLSASHDKSILVWTQDKNGNWTKQSVICENKLGCIKCVWSPNGKKFAVGCGDHKAYVGYYDTKNNWWSTMAIKGPKGSISALAFHPSSKAIAIGSMDFTVRLITLNLEKNYQSHIEDMVQQKNSQADIEQYKQLYIDQLNQEDPQYKGKFTLFDTYYESSIEISQNLTGGWIDSLAFSPNGQLLTFSVHNSSIFNIAITPEGKPTFNETPLHLKGLPVSCMLYKDDNTLIAGTYDGSVLQIESSASGIKLIKTIEASSDQTAFKVAQNRVGLAAQNMFRNSQQPVATSKFGHSNPIICLQHYPAEKNVISSNDINGQIFFWNV